MTSNITRHHARLIFPPEFMRMRALALTSVSAARMTKCDDVHRHVSRQARDGTSVGEVAVVTSLAPLCLILRGLLLILCHRKHKASAPPPSLWISHFLLDFGVIVVPLVLSYTALSDVLHSVITLAALVLVCLSLYIYRGGGSSGRDLRKTRGSFLHSRIPSRNRVPFVTSFRALVNVKTAVSILAVDFHVFPGRFAKTETYGTGLMDVGVGAYILANGLVSPEARRRREDPPGCWRQALGRQLLSVWPLVVLGLGRLASVKMADYHVDVTEYGLHWNFFFTLAAVRVLASVLLTAFPVDKSWLAAISLCVFYQFALETSALKSFVIDNDCKRRSQGFLGANKEGIFSIAGYLAIYMAGVQIGLYIARPRTRVKEWLRVMASFLFGSGALYCTLHACQVTIEPASRRMANAPFCAWIVAQCLFSMSCLGLAEIILLYVQSLSACYCVPSSWNPYNKGKKMRSDDVEGLCLLQAVNRNPLLFFVLANIMTGLINVTVDTFSVGRYISVCLLLTYMFINCCVVQTLHSYGVTVKFW